MRKTISGTALSNRHKGSFFLRHIISVNLKHHNEQQQTLINLTSFVNFKVCRASSLVGVRMRALAPVWAWGAFSFSNMGTRKAAVLPLPVLAMATTSLPSKITGIVWRGEEKSRAWDTIQLEVTNVWLQAPEVAPTYLSLDRGRNFVTFPHDAFIYRVTKTWNHTQCG